MLPRTIPITTAAAMSGYSPKTFRARLLEPGLMAIEQPPGGHPRVVLASLEQALSRQFTAAEYLAADRKLEPLRAYQSQYRQRAPHSGRQQPDGPLKNSGKEHDRQQRTT